MWIVGLVTASHARASSSAFALSGLNHLTGPDQIFILFLPFSPNWSRIPQNKRENRNVSTTSLEKGLEELHEITMNITPTMTITMRL